jgi:PKD domain
VLRPSSIPALVVLSLALAPASAQALPYEIAFTPAAPVAGEQVAFHAERVSPGQGAGDTFAWDFGDATPTATGRDVSHTYGSAGTYGVTLVVSEPSGAVSVEIATVNVAPNAAPSVAFAFAPASPVEGENVAFTPTVSDPEGHALTLAWNLGDGAASSDAAPVHSYAAAGDYPVTLTATDVHGAAAFSSQTVTVREAPDGLALPPVGGLTGSGGVSAPIAAPQRARRLVRMRPFPLVRIAGVVLDDGALVRILSVRAARGARVRVRCRGRGCPARAVARTSATRLVRFHTFERKLKAGVRLELFVRAAGRIGKYTRFRIRAGEAPARVDRCLVPGRKRPVRCG